MFQRDGGLKNCDGAPSCRHTHQGRLLKSLGSSQIISRERHRAHRRYLSAQVSATALRHQRRRDLSSLHETHDHLPESKAPSPSPVASLADCPNIDTSTKNLLLLRGISQAKQTPDPASSTSSSSRPSPLVQPVFTPTDTLSGSDHINTEQTTPLGPKHGLNDNALISSGLDTDSISTFSLSRSTVAEDDDEFTESVWMIRGDGEKTGARMALDTQSSRNILCLEIAERLELNVQAYDCTLLPFQTTASPTVEIRSKGIMRDVDWYIDNGRRTFTSDFVVVDMKYFDAILGKADIHKFKLLVPGCGCERFGVDRDLQQRK